MAIVLALLAGLLGLVVLVVVVPFRARATGSVHDATLAGNARFDWALGFLSLDVDPRRAALRVASIPVARFPLGTEREREKQGPRRVRRREQRREKGMPGTPARIRAVVAEREALQRIFARLGRTLHLRVRARGSIGTGDPADAAALAALGAALGAIPGVELALGIDWIDEALELELELAARIWIAQLLLVAAAVLLARRDRRALRAAFGRVRT